MKAEALRTPTSTVSGDIDNVDTILKLFAEIVEDFIGICLIGGGRG